MAQEDREYLNQIQKQWGYFGVYPPNRPIALGDYGKRQGDEFEKLGNIGKWIDPKPASRSGGPMLFTSNGDVKTTLDFGAADKAGMHAVNLKLTFTKKWAIFFQAHETTIVSTSNLMRVGDRIVDEYHKAGNAWQLSHEWVAELVQARVLTVMVAQSSGSVIQLDGQLPIKYQGVPVGELDLRGFKVSRQTGSVSITGPTTDATPLFKLYQVKDSAFKKAEYAEVR